MPTRRFGAIGRAVRIVATATAVSLALSGCSAADDASTPGERTSAPGDPSGSPDREPLTELELPAALTSSWVTVASSFGGDRLVALAHGVPELDDSLWAIDPDTGEAEELPGLQFPGWVGDAVLAATDRYVVLAARTCSRPPVAGDAGFECDGDASTRVALHDSQSGRWVDLESPVESLARIVEVTDQTATLAADAWTDEGGTARLTWTLDPLTGTQSEPEPAPEGGRCRDDGGPALRIEGPQDAQVAVLPGAADAPRVPLPVAVEPMRVLGPDGMLCLSSGPFLAIPGSVGSGPSNPHPPGEEASRNPTSTTSTAPPDPRLTVYDLRHPDASPTKVGDTGSVSAFVSGDDFWAVQDVDGIHVFRTANGASEPAGTVLHPDGRRGVLVATASALLAVSHGEGGSLGALHRVAI